MIIIMIAIATTVITIVMAVVQPYRHQLSEIALLSCSQASNSFSSLAWERRTLRLTANVCGAN